MGPREIVRGQDRPHHKDPVFVSVVMEGACDTLGIGTLQTIDEPLRCSRALISFETPRKVPKEMIATMKACLNREAKKRPTIAMLLKEPWLEGLCKRRHFNAQRQYGTIQF